MTYLFYCDKLNNRTDAPDFSKEVQVIDFRVDSPERTARLEELADAATERLKNEYRRESREQSIEFIVRASKDVPQVDSIRSLVEGLISGILLDRKLTRRSAPPQYFHLGRRKGQERHWLERTEEAHEERVADIPPHIRKRA